MIYPELPDTMHVSLPLQRRITYNLTGANGFTAIDTILLNSFSPLPSLWPPAFRNLMDIYSFGRIDSIDVHVSLKVVTGNAPVAYRAAILPLDSSDAIKAWYDHWVEFDPDQTDYPFSWIVSKGSVTDICTPRNSSSDILSSFSFSVDLQKLLSSVRDSLSSTYLSSGYTDTRFGYARRGVSIVDPGPFPGYTPSLCMGFHNNQDTNTTLFVDITTSYNCSFNFLQGYIAPPELE